MTNKKACGVHVPIMCFWLPFHLFNSILIFLLLTVIDLLYIFFFSYDLFYFNNTQNKDLLLLKKMVIRIFFLTILKHTNACLYYKIFNFFFNKTVYLLFTIQRSS